MFALAFLVLAKPPLGLRLSSPQTTYSSGQPILVRVEATNQTGGPIALALPRDGTNRGLRAPFMELQVRKLDGSWVRAFPPGLAWCGNTNAPAPDDYLTLVPGAKRVVAEGPDQLAGEALAKPGTYRLRYTVDTRPELSRWRGFPGIVVVGEEDRVEPFVQAAYDAAPKGLFVSNEIKVRIVAPR